MPLVLPETYVVYRILGIDPGLNNTGVACFDIDYSTRSIKRIEAFTVCNDKLFNNTGLDPEICSERTIKLYKLKFAIQQIISNYMPSVVACESPFYNRFRPMAYGSLLEVLSMIHSSVIDYNPNIPFCTVEPLLVKKIIGAGMMKGKLDVKLAVQSRADIMSVLVNDIDALDEHSIDAIAVGYTFLNRGV